MRGPSDLLDLSGEVTPPPDHPLPELGWLAPDLALSERCLALGPDHLAELKATVEVFCADPRPIETLSSTELRLPAWQALSREIKHQLDHGPGFVVLDRLPTDEATGDQIIKFFWLIGQLLEQPVAQKWDCTLLYEVRDTGQSFGYGVRGSYTNIELFFHTDNAFDRMPPDYVGLFCWRQAKAGGASRFCSLLAVHEALRQEDPELLARLYQPFCFDRQAEHAPDAPKVTWAPVFRFQHNRLRSRVNVSLIRSGFGLAGRTVDDLGEQALLALEAKLQDERFWVELPLECGQVQYLNNHRLAHYRSAFVDHDEPERRRHLFRTWHRGAGSSAYDGT